MGAAAAGVRPPSAAFRPPTGSAAGGLGGPGLLSSAVPSASAGGVELSARPVTSAGLSGAASGRPVGPSRQVADRSYWQAELRLRLSAIAAESERLQRQQAAIAKDNSVYGALERRYEAVMREVRGLEGELADHNLALDKTRSQQSVDELRSAHERLQQRNRETREQADSLFLSCGQQEARRAELQSGMERLEAEALQAVRVLGDDKLSEFEQLQAERAIWRQRRQHKAERLREAQQHSSRLLSQQQSAEHRRKQQAQAVQASSAALSSRLSELSADLQLAGDPAALKERLTAQIRQVNEAVGGIESRRRVCESAVEALQAAQRQAEAEREEAHDFLSKETKYAAIRERERKMAQLITDFPSLLKAGAEAQRGVQRQVLAALSALAAERQRGSGVGDAAALSEMSAELSFKASRLQSSAETVAALDRERRRREEELLKIDSLDDKIRLELRQLQDALQDWRRQRAAFRSEDEWAAFHQAEKRRLTQDNARLRRERQQLQAEAAEAEQALEARRRSLSALLDSSSIAAQEASWQQLAADVFELQSFVAARQRQTQYDQLKQRCTARVRAINAKLVQRYGNSGSSTQTA